MGFCRQDAAREPLENGRAVPARTPQSDALSRDLLGRGFKFVGSTICYAFMQAVGMVNDRTIDCFRYERVGNSGTRRPLSDECSDTPSVALPWRCAVWWRRDYLGRVRCHTGTGGEHRSVGQRGSRSRSVWKTWRPWASSRYGAAFDAFTPEAIPSFYHVPL